MSNALRGTSETTSVARRKNQASREKKTFTQKNRKTHYSRPYFALAWQCSKGSRPIILRKAGQKGRAKYC